MPMAISVLVRQRGTNIRDVLVWSFCRAKFPASCRVVLNAKRSNNKPITQRQLDPLVIIKLLAQVIRVNRSFDAYSSRIGKQYSFKTSYLFETG